MPRVANFDKIVVARLELDALSQAPTIKVIAAYVDTTSGNTFGSGVFTAGFSQETMVLLQQLRTQIGLDIEAVMFVGGGAALDGTTKLDPTNMNPAPLPFKNDVPSGIGEDLAETQGLPGDRDRSLTT